MRFHVTANTVAVALIALGCSSSADDDDSLHGGATSGGAPGAGSGGSSLGGSSRGGTTGAAGKSTMSGAGTASSSAGSSSVGGSGGSAAGSTGGAAGKSAMDSGAGGMPAAGGGAGGSSGSGAGGVGAAGQNGGNGGTFLGCGGDGPCTGGTGGRPQGGRGGRGSAGMPGAGGGSAGAGACPASGHVSYTLAKNANPTADEQTAYDLITTAMDKAIEYYNCYTNITKAESVTYVPSVETADGNSNGSIRFGGKSYMEYITAMHEIAHTVGVGTYSQWGPLIVNGIFTGEHATAQLRAITGIADDQVHGDTQHFWPYGLNYTSEVKSEADVIDHCLLVVAIRLDMGFDP